jgi:branched-chain amino acid aminotransferase
VSRSGPTSLASLDGEIMLAAEATIPATDDGLIRGDGAFEVIRVYDGRPYAMDAHMERLERSGANLRLPIDSETVRTEAYKLLAETTRSGAPGDHRLLRIMITRGGRRVMLTERLPPVPETVRVMSVRYSPTLLLDAIKSLSYGANMLATRLAQEAGFDEALLVTPDGMVLEAPTSSIFWVLDGRLETTPLDDHVLASITRALIADVTEVTERSIALEDLYGADEVFLASTAREVVPVTAVDAQAFAASGPVTARTAQLVADRIAAELG